MIFQRHPLQIRRILAQTGFVNQPSQPRQMATNFGSPIGLVDMAASFVTDIILLPVDLLVEDPGGSKKVLCEIKWGP
ncbi:MAG: hypothetical protein JKX72_12710 [Robiginitomaculum sp.]|nr:hypothetical protein [Robiginitomaculum sp.]